MASNGLLGILVKTCASYLVCSIDHFLEERKMLKSPLHDNVYNRPIFREECKCSSQIMLI